MVKTQEYQEMPQSGLKSNGKPRTQLELVPVKFPFHMLFLKLLDKLRVGRCHMNDTWWANKSICNWDSRVTERRPHLHYDFAATMRLFAMYKQNCHEDAHVADFVSMGVMNPRTVVVKVQEQRQRIYIRENWATHSSFDTISPGKKTDAIGIRYLLHEDLVLMFRDVLEKNPHWTLGVDLFLEVLAITLDNCANQNNCAKHYWNIVNLYLDIAPRLIVIYLQHQKSLYTMLEDRSVATGTCLIKDIFLSRLKTNEDTRPSADMDPANPWPLTVNTQFPRVTPEDMEEEMLLDVDKTSICSSSLDSFNIPSCNIHEVPGLTNASRSTRTRGINKERDCRSGHLRQVLGTVILVRTDAASTTANHSKNKENPWPMLQ
jgi:hypothetical protein